MPATRWARPAILGTVISARGGLEPMARPLLCGIGKMG
jgi:hypothetical protein